MSVIRYENVPIKLSAQTIIDEDYVNDDPNPDNPYPTNPSDADILSLKPAVWFDSSDRNTMYKDTYSSEFADEYDYVMSWKDKSKNNRHAFYGEPPVFPVAFDDNGPQLLFNVQNGLSALSFNDSLLAFPRIDLTRATVFAVAKIDGDPNTEILQNIVTVAQATEPPGGEEDGGYPAIELMMGRGDNFLARVGSSNGSNNNYAAGGDAMDDQWKIVSAQWRGGSNDGVEDYALWDNGSPLTSLTSVPQDRPNPFTVGRFLASYIGMEFITNYVYAIKRFKGYIGDIIVFPYVLNQQQRESVERYLSNKWNLVVDHHDPEPPPNNTGPTDEDISLLNPSVWFDASDESTTFSSADTSTPAVQNSAVQLWKDKSGNGRDAVNPTNNIKPEGSSPPNLIKNVKNNRNVLRFGGSYAGKNALSFPGIDMTAATAFAVIYNLEGILGVVRNVVVVSQDSLATISSPEARNQALRYPAIELQLINSPTFLGNGIRVASNGIGNNYAMGGETNPNTWKIVCGQWRGGGDDGARYYGLWQDGIEKNMRTVTYRDSPYSSHTYRAMRLSYIGAEQNYALIQDQGTSYFEGDIAEIIVFPYVLSPNQRELVERYLSNKWNISVSHNNTPQNIAPMMLNEQSINTFNNENVDSDVFVALATDLRISHAAKVDRKTMIGTDLPEMRVGGPVDTKLSFSFPICNKFNDGTSEFLNLASGIFSKELIGTGAALIKVGDTSFNACYLDRVSIDVEPFKPATMSVDFTCTRPPTGLSIVTGTPIPLNNFSENFAYGHLAVVNENGIFSSDIRSSISFSIDLKRTYTYNVGLTNTRRVFIDESSKQLQIKATNISTFTNVEGLISDFQMDLKNELGESILPNGTISINSNGRLNVQNINVTPQNILIADVSIIEPLL